MLTTGFGIFQTDLSTDVNSLLNEANGIELKNIKGGSLIVRIPKVDNKSLSSNIIPSQKKNEVKNCEKFRKGTFSVTLKEDLLNFASRNATPCISFYMPYLPHDQGYAVFVQNQNTEGRPLHLWILNETEKSTILDTYLKPSKNLSSDSYVIPPHEQFGQSYSLNFENSSIGEETKNSLGKISVFPIPYSFLNSIVIANSLTAINEPSPTGSILNVQHPNESIYVIEGDFKKNDNLILSQSYDAGWKAYEVKNSNFLSSIFPFFTSSELKDHVLVNNWENGWVLNSAMKQSSNETIILVYLPQYLEYLGFLVLIFSIIFLSIRKRV